MIPKERITPTQLSKHCDLSVKQITAMIKKGEMPSELYYVKGRHYYFHSLEQTLEVIRGEDGREMDETENYFHEIDSISDTEDLEFALQKETIKKMFIDNKKQSGMYIEKYKSDEKFRELSNIIVNHMEGFVSRLTSEALPSSYKKQVSGFCKKDMDALKKKILAML